jgi:mannose-6-phosphate isomerase-like protein (cupin superfamily)
VPDDRCQAPHWGYLFTGKIVVDYGDRSETVEAGQAYYIAPGHLITFLEDSEALEFTPTEELEKTFEAVRRNAATSAT